MSDDLIPGRCNAVNAAGEPCGQVVAKTAVLCRFHDPATAELMRADSARGLERAHEKNREEHARRIAHDDPPIDLEMTPEGVMRYQADIIQRLATGRLDPKTANGISYALVGLRKDVDADELRRNLKQAQQTIADLTKKIERMAGR